MANKVRYLETRTRVGGKTVYVVNPPRYVRSAFNVGYEQYETYAEAVERATSLYDAYMDHKRRESRSIAIKTDTVDGIISHYRTTREWSKLTLGSKRAYNGLIKVASSTRVGASNVNFGQMLVRSVTVSHADKLHDTIVSSVSKARAYDVVKVLRKVWFVAKRHSLVEGNPFERMNLSAPKSREVLWEPEQVATFITQADAMGMQGMGTLLLLCYDLCQRPGDMRNLKWADFDGSTFKFTQQKTGTPMEIPASPRLIRRLASPGPSDEHIVLDKTYGKHATPFNERRYQLRLREIMEAAGLPQHLQVRDLRRTGATELAESGATEDELRSITGHKSRDVLSIYVRPTKKLALSAQQRRFTNG